MVTSPIEPALTRRLPPWSSPAGVTFRLDIGPGLPLGAGAQKKKEVADNCLAALPQCATWVWTDGSAEGEVTNGGAGALIDFPDGEKLSCGRPPVASAPAIALRWWPSERP